MKRQILIFICILSTYIISNAQADNIHFNNICGSVVDSLTSEPIAGAFITIINQNGAYHFAADKDGKFKEKVLKGGEQVKIEVTMLGYRICRKILDADTENIEAGSFHLIKDIEELDAAVVKGRRELFKQKGDTLIFFPSSLLLRETASAKEVLEKMPGVVSDETGINVMGQRIERTYVNGKLVFGKDNPLNALENIDAKDVSAILAYDEYDELSKIQHGKDGRKRRVLNVITFDLFNQSLVAKVMAEGGADLQKEGENNIKGRYLAGAGIRFFTEQRQMTVDYVGNNINNTKNNGRAVHETSSFTITDPGTYKEENKFLVHYADKIKKTFDISGKYEYEDSYSKTKSVLNEEYFKSEENDTRNYTQSLLSSSIDSNHKADLKLEHIGTQSFFDMNLNANWIKGRFKENNINILNSNNITVNNTILKELRKSRMTEFNADANYSIFTSAGSVSAEVSANFGDQKTHKDYNENERINLSDKSIVISGTGKARNITGNVSYSYNTDKAGSFSVTYNANYLYDKKIHTAINESTQEIDRALSRLYTDNLLINSGKLEYDYDRNKLRISAGVEYQNKIVNRDDRIENTGWNKKIFHSILPRFTIGYKEIGKNISFSYSTDCITPSLEMFANRLDYDNPMYLSLGNENLKQGYNHNFYLSWFLNLPKEQLFTGFGIRYTLKNNTIGNRNEYFKENTYLEEYDYQVLKGANLSRYENLNGAMSLIVNGYINYYVNKIQCELKLNLNYIYDVMPMYIGKELTKRINHSPNLEFGIESNFSKHFRFDINYKLRYSESHAVLDNRYSSVINQLKVNLEADFLKRMFANATFELYNDHNITTSKDLLFSNKLSMSVGCRLFKNKRGAVTVSVYDMLNSDKSFKQNVYADRISSNWTYRTPRYAVIGFSYSFNHSK